MSPNPDSASTRTRIVATAEQVFDRHGFAATGIDSLTAAAGVSTRTLYKHLHSKEGLVVAVLQARQERFLASLDAQSVHSLFSSLARWADCEGARGCLFLRAQGETGGLVPEVSAVVADYRNRLRAAVGDAVNADLGRADASLTDQILVLVEGAVSASTYRGAAAYDAARAAAATVLEHARHRR